jgi:YggT family protein
VLEEGGFEALSRARYRPARHAALSLPIRWPRRLASGQHTRFESVTMAALIFLLETLLSLCMMAVLLRLLLQWSRADFRNPLARSILHLTNPVIVPLRRLLPAIGRVDTASCVAVVVFALLEVVCISWLLNGFGPPTALIWLQLTVIEIVRTTLRTYMFAIFLYALLSLIAPGVYSPAQSLLVSLCEPILRPFRRFIPSIGGLDLSPLWAIIAIQTLLILLP